MAIKILQFSAIFLFATVTSSQDYSGKYFVQDGTTRVNLLLEKVGSYDYVGNLVGNGMAFTLSASIQDGKLVGRVDHQTIFFEGTQGRDQITVKLFEKDQFGNPELTTMQTIVFNKSGDSFLGSPIVGGVVINGRILTEDQISMMEKRYGQKPLEGDYWYDRKSGLFGVVGYPAYGFMHPGHSFGALSRQISKGNTNVIVNGRELPQSELAVWSYMIGSYILPGTYWLDHMGNAGYEGNPAPTINLFDAGAANQYAGKGSEGDNFWSTRFSAGNYNNANTKGYVSVPGYGPIGYGFN